MTVDEIIREIAELPETEQRTIHDAIGKRLHGRSEQELEEEFARKMEAEGKLRRPDRSRRIAAEDRAPIVHVTGEPVSETIIRERR